MMKTKLSQKIFCVFIIAVLTMGFFIAFAPKVTAQTTYTTIADWEGANTATSEFTSFDTSGATLAINTVDTYVSHGSQSLEISGLDSAYNYGFLQKNITATNVVNQTFSVYFTSQLNINSLLTIYFAGETYDHFTINLIRVTDGNYVWQTLASETALNYNSTEFSLALNTAYFVNFYYVNDPVIGSLILQINNIPVINHVNINTGTGNDKIVYLRIEAACGTTNTNAATVYYDYFQYISGVISQSTNAQTSNIFGVDEGVWDYLTLADFQTMQYNHVNTFRINEYTSWWDANLSSAGRFGNDTIYTQAKYKQIKDWCSQTGINLEIMTGGTDFQPPEGWSQMKADVILNLNGAQTAYINSYGDLISKIHPWAIEIMNEPPKVSDTNFTGSYTDLTFSQAYQTFCYNAISAWRTIQPNITIIVQPTPFYDFQYFAQNPVITTNEIVAFHYYYSDSGNIPPNLDFLNGDSANYQFWIGNFSEANRLLAPVILQVIDLQPILNLGLPVMWEECGTNTADPNTNQFILAVKNFTSTYHMGVLAHSWYYANEGFLQSDWATFNIVGQEWFQTFIPPTPTPTPTYTSTPTSTPTITASPIGLNEIILFVSFFTFLSLAFYLDAPFFFVVSGFLAVLCGIDILLIGQANNVLWSLQFVGLIIMGLGVYLFGWGFSNQLKTRRDKKQ